MLETLTAGFSRARERLAGVTTLSDANLDDVGDVPATINYRDVVAPILRRHAPDIDLTEVFPGHVFRS